MKFRVLGNFQIGRDELGYTIAAPKQRQLLALLLLNANAPVSPRTCFRELWSEYPPSSAATTLQTYIMNLRRALADSSGRARLVLDQAGYRLVVDPGELDLDVFDATVEQADASGDDGRTLQKLSAALDLWPGSMLSDITRGPVLSALVARHERRRIDVVYRRFDLMLELDRARPALPELKRAVEQYPADERLRRQLMLALASTGRRAESILQFRALSHYLHIEMRTEPSSATKDLELSLRRA
ncbi:AfsR/SARP family transcriptional regulator [Rhodococcoides kyotonense]|uniref:DNA-binding transcriptional activator of the SARP family n=1 Tax=Rhodococcoides kyotonense TaxID=398843 RepID=A0A239MCH6_9NOCA|nr:BTAD domain-containing putative transcriptional regulator [Rhodococcus kyotonensis]SNT39734.1 DNA-binding transcriptional activator of the SARP family [Rhodococcus kyotonensis]